MLHRFDSVQDFPNCLQSFPGFFLELDSFSFVNYVDAACGVYNLFYQP